MKSSQAVTLLIAKGWIRTEPDSSMGAALPDTLFFFFFPHSVHSCMPKNFAEHSSLLAAVGEGEATLGAVPVPSALRGPG